MVVVEIVGGDGLVMMVRIKPSTDHGTKNKVVGFGQALAETNSSLCQTNPSESRRLLLPTR